jgi:hypothetical protein
VTRGEALDLLQREGQSARDLAATRKGELQAIYRDALAAELGVILLVGGPRTKDELINAIMNLWYPVAEKNEAIHLAYHREPGLEYQQHACSHCETEAADGPSRA